MRTILRSLILWLALLAVPFQSVAAAATMPLAPALQGQYVPRSASAHPAMRHPEPAQHHEARAVGVQGQCHGKVPAHDYHASDKCSSCCTGPAMAAATLPVLAVAPPPSLSIPFDARYLPSIHPPVPERPPSLILA